MRHRPPCIRLLPHVSQFRPPHQNRRHPWPGVGSAREDVRAARRRRQRRAHQRVARHAGNQDALDRVPPRARRVALRSAGDPARPAGAADTHRIARGPDTPAPRAARRLCAGGRGGARRDTHHVRGAGERRARGRADSPRRRAALAGRGGHLQSASARQSGVRRRAQGAQGDEPPGHRGQCPGAHPEGPRGRQAGSRRRRRLHRAVVRPPARGHRAVAGAGAAVDEADRENREGHGPRQPLRHSRCVGRDHGGARRSRRRAALRGSAAHAEAHHP